MLGVDLSSAAVFLDFDGAVAARHRHVLVTAAAPGWEAIEEQYERGIVVSRERLLDEWDLLEADVAMLGELVDDVVVDPGFARFVEWLRALGAWVTVVSDGFGIAVDSTCAGLDVTMLANEIDAHG